MLVFLILGREQGCIEHNVKTDLTDRKVQTFSCVLLFKLGFTGRYTKVWDGRFTDYDKLDASCISTNQL